MNPIVQQELEIESHKFAVPIKLSYRHYTISDDEAVLDIYGTCLEFESNVTAAAFPA